MARLGSDCKQGEVCGASVPGEGGGHRLTRAGLRGLGMPLQAAGFLRGGLVGLEWALD